MLIDVYHATSPRRHSNKEAQDEDNDTPLLTAVEYGSAECAGVLLEHGARVDAVDRQEQNAVHVAAKYNEIKTMQVQQCRTSQIHYVMMMSIRTTFQDSLTTADVISDYDILLISLRRWFNVFRYYWNTWRTASARTSTSTVTTATATVRST